jgi:uncharacterized protein involved in response to NO
MQNNPFGETVGERRKAVAGPPLPLLTYGFRPFFLGASVFAVLAMALWIGWLAGLLTLAGNYGALAWHAHEMIFGYTAAVISGFLLTAVPNWTGRRPVDGWRLLFLFLLWCAGRLAFLMIGLTSPLPAIVLDSLFLPCLFLVVAREVALGRSWRNLTPLVLVGLLAISNIGFHAEVLNTGNAGLAGQAGVAVIVVLIILIGGRIVPNFTRTYLSRKGATHLPVSFNRFDIVSLATAAIALIAWVAGPRETWTGVLFLLAALLQFVRMTRWAGLYVWSNQLVFVLHLGYLFVPLGFLLGGVSILLPGSLAGSAVMHAWTVGAIGVMTLAVMTRATLGHTGRELAASGLTVAAYGAIVASAVLRIAAGAFPNAGLGLIDLAGFAWIAGFSLFAIEYVPMLVRARLDHR